MCPVAYSRSAPRRETPRFKNLIKVEPPTIAIFHQSGSEKRQYGQQSEPAYTVAVTAYASLWHSAL